MKVMTVLGTRPEIIRLSRIIEKLDRTCQHVLVHTGQNYDPNLNDVFFQQLGVRAPDHYLNTRGSLGEQLGILLAETEKILEKEKPDKLLVLGDTNSALSAIIAKRNGIPVYHMEAGNRCYDDRVPEEVNRRIIDHSSDVLMPYTERSRQNLLREGIAGERIFVTGISNGGLMSYRLGCSLPDKIRAIAPVTAQIPAAIAPLCGSESTVSLAVFNGTADPLVPYDGGQITVFRRQRGAVLSTDETMRIWRRKNRCSPEAGVTELPDVTDDGTRVTKIEYSRCKNESKVVLYRIEGGGHTWPDGRQYLPARRIGRTTRDINGCDEIWQFFRSLN